MTIADKSDSATLCTFVILLNHSLPLFSQVNGCQGGKLLKLGKRIKMLEVIWVGPRERPKRDKVVEGEISCWSWLVMSVQSAHTRVEIVVDLTRSNYRIKM